MSLLLLSATALASAPYPGEIFNHLELDVAPGCEVCHQDGITGSGTVTTPFGAALFDLGLRSSEVDNLGSYLDDLDEAGTDSDADGVGDIQELLDGTNPNIDDQNGALMPKYGCLQVVPASATWLLVAFGLVSIRRR